MKLSLSPDTLAYQLGVRPALQFRDMGKAPLRKVVDALNQFQALPNAYEWLNSSHVGKLEKPMGKPEKDAVVFYMLHHAVNSLRMKFHPLEPLPESAMRVLDLYHAQMALRGTRMFYYLLLICVRESRHSSGAKGSAEKEMRAKYTDAVVNFHAEVEDMSESAAVAHFQKKPPDVPLTLWVNFMSEHFRKYSYGHAFGGEKWGVIADVVRDFVEGKTSLAMLLDTSFTLAHNTSAIFDKGMLYEHYGSDLQKILDVQHSGQIPQLVKEYGVKVADLSANDVHEMLALCDKTIEGFSDPGYVDWYKVESLSTKSAKYPMEKKTQSKLHGTPLDSPGKEFVKHVKEEKAKVAEEQEALAMVQIFPAVAGKAAQYIKKVARSKE